MKTFEVTDKLGNPSVAGGWTDGVDLLSLKRPCKKKIPWTCTKDVLF